MGKDNIAGDSCDKCAAGHYNFPTCEACQCDVQGSVDNTCNAEGVCTCNHGYTGDKCDECIPHHYMHNNVCEECECNEDGSVDDTCDADGKCTCKEHIAGDKCDEAEPGYTNSLIPHLVNVTWMDRKTTPAMT